MEQEQDTDISELVARMRADGHEVRAEGDEVMWNPPPSGSSEELRRKFTRRKAEFLAFLMNEGSAALRKEAPLTEAALERSEPLAGGLHRVSLRVPSDLGPSYLHPGQYTQVGINGDRGYFVLANDPHDPTWDLIVRPNGHVAAALAAAEPGSVVGLSAALGAGFPLLDVMGQLIAVAVVGTGIAAGRPIVRERIRTGDGSNTRIYIGVRTTDDIPFRSEIEEWLAAGVGVTVCLSRGESNNETDMTKLRLVAGYVQHALARDLPSAPPVSIFVVGPSVMVEDVRNLAPVLLMAQRDVRTNY